MADPEVKIRVRTTEAGGPSALQKARRELGELVNAVPGVSAVLGRVATVTGVVATAIAGAAKSLREFAKGQDAVAGLGAALAQTGNLTEETSQRLQGLASALQEATAIADDEWIGVLTRLVQFGAKPESLGMHAESVKNLAGVVGSLSTATDLYSRALQGNFEMLGRYGIRVKDLEELQRVAAERGGGQLEARAKTLSGQFRNLTNSVRDVFEAFGQVLNRSPLLSGWMEHASGVWANLAARIGSAHANLETYNRGTAGAAEAMARYREQAQQVLALTGKQVEQLRAEAALLESKRRILDELTDTEAAMRIAMVDAQVATGKMTEPQAVRARAGIRMDAAREKITREQQTAQARLQAERDGLAALEERKAAIDKDLAKERKALIPDEKLATIRSLVLSAAQSRQDYARAAKFAGTEYAGYWGGSEQANRYLAGARDDIAQMRDFEARALARTENRAAQRRDRVATLEGMSRTLGEQIAAGRAALPEMTARTGATVLSGNMQLATAQAQQVTSLAQGSNGRLDSATRTVVAALQETQLLARTLLEQGERHRREIAQLRAQVKDHANK